ncbi:CPBP family intramembrane metalloprotease [Lactobacillus sp. ESL0791]|uniref:CPBP family intramembrane glutamic endopeptidase n=1 Tax=Lactobacillus sp. ESL0791 TaxID=2983234 RepID=UPI0023FA3B2A|nr:CPBP family intramembrane glutamic endopeptidase [Lactobacillus sp. ESL0791]MDF7638347.1 CPBP family intramembrane metalloprotease [Lactobacillus sp. ESL0791]
MFSEKILKRWHLWQTWAQIVILLTYNYFTKLNIQHLGRTAKLSQLILIKFCLLLACLEFFLLKKTKNPTSGWQQFNHYFQAIAVTFTLQESLNFLLMMLAHFHILTSTFWVAAVTLYSFVMYIPMTMLALVKIQNNWGRIIILFAILFGLLVGTPSSIAEGLKYAKPLKILTESGLSGTFILIIVTAITMREWGFHSPHCKINSQVSKGMLLGLLLIIVATTLFNGFSTAASFNNLFTAWNFKLVKVNWKLALTAVEAGIAEEWLNRYCVLNLLARIFKNTKQKLILLVVTDGIIFGLFHFGNLTAQPLSATLEQMFAVGSWALFIAALYLYTDSLTITMIYHGCWDLLAFFTTGTTHESVPTTFDWQLDIVFLIIYAALAYFLISGKRKEVVENNLHQAGL